MNNFFEKYFKSLDEATRLVNHQEMTSIAKLILKSNNSSGKIIIIGNGGSSAISSHVAIDFTKAANIRAINFNESSLITCFANDYGYEHWVEKAIEFYADRNDLVILISSSGSSKNIINGAKKAKEMDLPLITFSGFSSNNELRKIGDINLWVDSSKYNVVEIVHQTWILSIIDYLIDQKT